MVPEKCRFFERVFTWLVYGMILFCNMSTHTPVTKSGMYFITFTCYQWLPLIELTNGYNFVYNWFRALTAKGHVITGYVIMPNHLHLLLYYLHAGSSLNNIIGNGKRFMAYDIVDTLERQQAISMLERLQLGVGFTDRKRGKKHEIWINSFDVKECRTEKFILQKLNYIHNNPCSGKWRLSVSPIHYLHSSASFYASGKTGAFPVRDYRKFL
jgi:REP element-mobilizing transposase RayT